MRNSKQVTLQAEFEQAREQVEAEFEETTQFGRTIVCNGSGLNLTVTETAKFRRLEKFASEIDETDSTELKEANMQQYVALAEDLGVRGGA